MDYILNNFVIIFELLQCVSIEQLYSHGVA